MGTEFLKSSKQSSTSVKSSSPVTSHNKEKPAGGANDGKSWSSVVDFSVDPLYKPSSVIASWKKTYDHGTSAGMQLIPPVQPD